MATPASPPTAALVAAKGNTEGLKALHTSELNTPVAMPAHGPANAATSTVPVESRYSGIPTEPIIWPTTIFSTSATGIIDTSRAGNAGTVATNSSTAPVTYPPSVINACELAPTDDQSVGLATTTNTHVAAINNAPTPARVF